MLDSSNIILISIIGLLILFLVYMHSDNEQEKFSGLMAQPIYKYKYRSNPPGYAQNDELVDDVVSWDDSVSSANITKEVLNPNFVGIQFHNDYRDIIDAINNLVPEKRQRFNLANIPLAYSEPNSNEVKNIIKDFLHVLNDNLKFQVPTIRSANSGWDEKVVDKSVESGWSKVQRSLGLADSIYKPPAPKSKVKLIAIQYVQKYETDDEIKYNINLVIQKLNTEDQMVIKCSFVQDKRPMTDENNFFVSKNIDMKIIIEDIYVNGFLSNNGPDERKNIDNTEPKYFNYNNLEYNNMTDPRYVQKVLMDKYKQRNQEMNLLTATLSEEGTAFHKSLPSVYDFSNIQNTQTIYDDFNNKKVFY